VCELAAVLHGSGHVDKEGNAMRHPKRAITRDIRTRRPKRPGAESIEQDLQGWPEAAIRTGDVMSRPVTALRQDMTVGAAVKVMRARKIRHLPVLDDKGLLVGMVSDRDLRQATLEPAAQAELKALGQALNFRPLKDVMTWGSTTAKPETGIREAAQLMCSNKIGALPVVDRGRVVGVLTATDLLKTLVRMIDEGVISRPGRWGAEG
jgi:CBS domain-containing protein